MRCKECISPKTDAICDGCRKMQAESRWNWEIDNGQRICRCPECGRGNLIGVWQYSNPYRYCPWCGEKMYLGEQMSLLDTEENDGRTHMDAGGA